MSIEKVNNSLFSRCAISSFNPLEEKQSSASLVLRVSAIALGIILLGSGIVVGVTGGGVVLYGFSELYSLGLEVAVALGSVGLLAILSGFLFKVNEAVPKENSASSFEEKENTATIADPIHPPSTVEDENVVKVSEDDPPLPSSEVDLSDRVDVSASQKSSVVPLKERYPDLTWCDDCGVASEKDRLKLVEEITREMEERHPDKTKVLTIVSLASGQLLQEFLIIKALHEVGYSRFSLVAIDHIYSFHHRRTMYEGDMFTVPKGLVDGCKTIGIEAQTCCGRRKRPMKMAEEENSLSGYFYGDADEYLQKICSFSVNLNESQRAIHPQFGDLFLLIDVDDNKAQREFEPMLYEALRDNSNYLGYKMLRYHRLEKIDSRDWTNE